MDRKKATGSKSNRRAIVVASATVFALVALTYVVLFAPEWVIDLQGGSQLRGKTRLDAISSTRQNLLFLLGGLIAVATIYLTFRRDQNSRRLVELEHERAESDRLRAALDRDANRTGRFAEAIKLLNNEDATIRMGAIYALERIARDSSRDQQPIVDILALYVRTRSPYNPIKPPEYEPDPDAPLLEVPRDVLAAASAISQITQIADVELQALDLRDADLRKADFRGARLPRVDSVDPTFPRRSSWGHSYPARTSIERRSQ